MKIQEDSLVGMYYQVTDPEGKVIDSTEEGRPFMFRMGSGQILKAIESQLLGMEPNEEKDFILDPESCYGPYRDELVREIPKNVFPEDVEKGQVYRTSDQDGNPLIFIIKDVTDETVVADFNHPLAGKSLSFHVKIASVE